MYVSHPPEELIVMYVSQLKKVFSNMVGTIYRSQANLHLHVNLKQAALERLIVYQRIHNTILALVIDSAHRAFACESYCIYRGTSLIRTSLGHKNLHANMHGVLILGVFKRST